MSCLRKPNGLSSFLETLHAFPGLVPPRAFDSRPWVACTYTYKNPSPSLAVIFPDSLISKMSAKVFRRGDFWQAHIFSHTSPILSTLPTFKLRFCPFSSQNITFVSHSLQFQHQMADSSTPPATEPAPPSVTTGDLIPVELPVAPSDNPSSSVLHTPIGAEVKIRNAYHSESEFFHINTPSSITPSQISDIRTLFNIPQEYKLRAPQLDEKIFWRPEGEWVAVPLYLLKYGVRFPLHEFISSFLSFAGIEFAQLVPNSYIHLISFVALCQEIGITPSLDFFFALFTIGRSKEPNLRQLNKQANRTVPIKHPTSNKGWHLQWIFVRGTDLQLLPHWAHPKDPIVKVSTFPKGRADAFKEFYKKWSKAE